MPVVTWHILDPVVDYVYYHQFNYYFLALLCAILFQWLVLKLDEISSAGVQQPKLVIKSWKIFTHLFVFYSM
jgi:hypothetical protein